MQTNWIVTLDRHQIIHQPTGVIFCFNASLDGSGTMGVDSPNPELLPPSMGANEAAKLAQEAWQVYAEAAEIALGMRSRPE